MNYLQHDELYTYLSASVTCSFPVSNVDMGISKQNTSNIYLLPDCALLLEYDSKVVLIQPVATDIKYGNLRLTLEETIFHPQGGIPMYV
jgi:hypothetical protein